MSNALQIHLNKTDFTGGEAVTGELELEIDTPIPVQRYKSPAARI